MSLKHLFLGFLSVLCVFQVKAQKVLTIKEAEQIAISNYGTIKAKASQLNSSKAFLKETKTEYLPDVNLSAQQVYGTANGQNGPLFGYNGLGVASSGPALPTQNYNAGFGSLYLANVNWNFFAFGRSKEKIKVQKTIVSLDENDYGQELFEHQVLVASTYLNLLAAQQLAIAEQDNLNRSLDLQRVVVARVRNGLNPGVDSSLASAEVSNARILLTNAQQTVQDQNNLLAQYLGIPPQNFMLDSVFVSKAPNVPDPKSTVNPDDHPLLKYYRSRIGVSDEQAKYYSTFSYPTFSLFGIYQGRGSDFSSGYFTNQNDFSSNYGAGVSPTRFNYLFGVGVTWNLTNPFRVHYQVKSQKFLSEQYRNEYDVIDQQLTDQQILAETRISTALKNFREVPVEVKAANDAYIQKYALYQNGLANIVDFTEALFTLNRAEIDKDITSNNVWQAVLYKAASTGDFGIFINNF